MNITQALDCVANQGTIELEAGGPGSGRHAELTRLAEKVGRERQSFANKNPATHEESQERIRQHIRDANSSPKELLNHLSKMAKESGTRRPAGARWLKNLNME